MSNYVSNVLEAIDIYEKKCCKQRCFNKFNLGLKKQKVKNVADIYNINKALTFRAFKRELEFVTIFKN